MSVLLIPILSQPGKHHSGLDTLTRTFKSDSPVDTVRAAAPARYSSASGYGGMYLMDAIAREGGSSASELDLIYHGSLDGSLPSPLTDEDANIHQARFTSFTGKTTVEITYVSPITIKRIFDNSPIDTSTIGAIAPADAEVIWFTAKTTEGVSIPGVGDFNAALAFFVQRTAILGKTTELVPGHYWTGIQTKQQILFSQEA